MSISQRIAALGGIRGIFHKLVRTKDLRAGTLVGTDENGNKYYEDYTYVFGRSRYVEYNENQRVPDVTTVAPEWHRWIHYVGEEPPSRRPVWQPEWKSPASPTKTGTNDAYVPYSTPPKKIHEWTP